MVCHDDHGGVIVQAEGFQLGQVFLYDGQDAQDLMFFVALADGHTFAVFCQRKRRMGAFEMIEPESGFFSRSPQVF